VESFNVKDELPEGRAAAVELPEGQALAVEHGGLATRGWLAAGLALVVGSFSWRWARRPSVQSADTPASVAVSEVLLQEQDETTE